MPMYTNAAGVIPVVEAPLGKGAALGTTLAFMMSVIALSLPEMIILKQVLTGRLIAIFLAVVSAGNRPRKTLGWRTPADAKADEIAAFKSTVALGVGI